MSLTIKELGSDFRLAIKLQWGMCPYDPEGLRVVKKAKGETTHYVFEGTEPIFEKRINAGKTKSYVYALGKYLARVDGVIGDPEAKKYFYHTDHAGSIRVITDQAGEVVYKADYFAFGTQFVKDGEFEELHGFTGKEYDPDIGLYYFNARWYDPDTGRFLSEDPAGQGPNPYSYCGNNPVMRVDPSGKIWGILIGAFLGGLDSYLCGGDFMQGFCMGAFTGVMGYGINAFVGQAWGTTLGAVGTRAASGAIAGGITGEMFGEGFKKGAVHGAVAGAISYGVDMRYGEYASRGTFNKLVVAGLKGGLNGLARGGDFIEGFAYGFAYGLGYEYGALLFDSSVNKNATNEPASKTNNIEATVDVNEKEVLKNAIETLEKTEWGKDNNDTIKRLWELFNKGRIKFDPKLSERGGIGRYSPNVGPLKREMITLDSYLLDVHEELLLVLAHEGVHALDDVEGRLWHGPKIRLSSEYRALIAEDTVNYELTGKQVFINLSNKEKYDYLMANYQLNYLLTYYNDMKWLKGK